MKSFFKYFAWISIYFLIPLIPFFISGLLTYYMQIKIAPDEFVKGFSTFINSFDFIKLIFSIGLIGLLIEQNIRNYKPIIPSEPVDKSGVAYCRITYIISFSLWGMYLFCDKLFNTKSIPELVFFINSFKVIGVLLFAFCILLVVVVQSSFNFQVE